MAKTPDTCPNCGADLPRNAKACPECGSDEQTGWSDRAGIQGLDLPDDNFDYKEFVDQEFGGRGKIRPRGMAWVWWIVAFALVAGLIVLLLWR